MAANDPRRKHHSWAPLHFVRARPWLMIATLLFVVATAVLKLSGLKAVTSVLLGFDLASLLYLSVMTHMFAGSKADHMAHRARAQDTGRRTTLTVAVGVACVVVVALGTEMHAAKSGGWPALAVAALTIVLSWLFMNTMYALHYAHDFYVGARDGLQFPGTKEPDYWDFVYFAFTIGMCFQVSDVQIASRTIRRTVLLHGVVGFFFNVFIIAISVNIAAGQS